MMNASDSLLAELSVTELEEVSGGYMICESDTRCTVYWHDTDYDPDPEPEGGPGPNE